MALNQQRLNEFMHDQRLKELLDKWELEISILLSLLLHIILTLGANLRKLKSSAWVTFVLWNVYVAVNSVANFCLSIMSRTLNDPGPRYNPDLLAFWTPFLLFHLGGPDSIAAFSLADSQLWLRNATFMFVQLMFTGYILMRTLTTHSKLFFPTIFVLAAGALKCGERTWALKRASMGERRTSLITERERAHDYAGFMEELSSHLRAGDAGMLTLRREKQRSRDYSALMKGLSDSNAAIIDPKELLYGAYLFFQIFECLFLDLILSFRNLRYCASIFRNSRCCSSRAFKMIEIELSYAYDIFYTKALVVHTTQGRIFRAISFCSILIAFCLVFSSVQQLHDDFQKKHIIVSFVLLAGTLALEFVSIGMMILSDWTVVMLRQSNLTRLEMLVFRILDRFHRLICEHRWSNQMGQYSLLRYTVDQRPKIVEKFLSLGLKEMWDKFIYVKKKKVTEELKDLIFRYLKDKLNKTREEDINRSLNTTRQGRQWASQYLEVCSMLKWSIEAEFDESLLTWHLATEICFESQKKLNSAEKKDSDVKDNCEASRYLSRYLLYLLLAEPSTMTSKAGLALIRHGDTYRVAKMFFKKERVPRNKSAAVKSLMKVRNYVRPDKVLKGDNKSILWDAVELARELQDLPEDERWKTACNVWIEMLAYVALQCKGSNHARLLSAGGELLTFVWLLEAHLGVDEFTTQYSDDEES